MHTPRSDLLALTPDDLAAMANRGLVKRAQREVESPEFSAEWGIDPDGTIRTSWSDGIDCVLPGGATLLGATCTCAALGMCRHILRTVLAWQIRRSASGLEEPGKEPAAESANQSVLSQAWDPGAITDEAVEAAVPRDRRERAAALWKQGVVAELLRGAKPAARFHVPGHSVRFLVKDDLRYTLCSCAEPAPCAHAMLAVRAFRELAPEKSSGLISTGDTPSAVDQELINRCIACAAELADEGFSGIGGVWRHRVLRLASACRESGLFWPAQICEELAADTSAYTGHDPLFSPRQSADRLGELLIRLDVIVAGTGGIPSAFVRGQKTDRDTDLGSTRFIGLGALAVEERNGCRLSVFLQEIDTGHVLSVDRAITEPADASAPPRPYHLLGRLSAAKDSNLFQLASGQLLLQGGRRTADGRIAIGRARAAVIPQTFLWEELKAPVLAEDFAEIVARLSLLPPGSVRTRRAAGDFQVCRLAGLDGAHFDAPSQRIIAVLRDRSGGEARLEHPWSPRGASGAGALLGALRSEAPPVFVAGHVAMTHAGWLVWHPTAIILDNAGTRRAILPWISPPDTTSPPVSPGTSIARAPLPWPAEVLDACADILVTGRLRRAHHARWEALAAAGEARGYARLPSLVRAAHQPGGSSQAFLNLLKAVRLAADLVPE
jgi:hypothetical protein